MAAYVVDLNARCLLCGTVLSSVGRGGRITATADLHPVPVFRRGGAGEGITLCDDCALVAAPIAGLSLN